MGSLSETRPMHQQTREDWGDELPGLSLHYFADKLPAAYHRDRTGKDLEDFPVLRRYEVRAKTRRGCLASRLSLMRDQIAADIHFFDEAVREGRGVEYQWYLANRLPKSYRAGYDRDFHRRMLAIAISLRERMADGTFTVPHCTAEELLLSIILDEYAVMLNAMELAPGYWDLGDRWFEDEDYLLLYQSEVCEQPQVMAAVDRQLFTVNLDFSSWFKPFRGGFTVPGPTSERVIRRINGQ